MIATGRRLIAVGMIAVALSAGAIARAEGPDDEAQAAIRAAVAKINRAWATEDGVELMREVLSDKAFSLAMPRSTQPELAAVLDKDAFCRHFDEIVRERRPRRYDHRVESITVVGPLAYEAGRVEMIAADGQQRRFEVVNVFAREESGWRLISASPAEHLRAALADAAPADTDDAEQVRGLAVAFSRVFCTKDPTPVAALEQMLADDFTQVGTNGRVYRGKQANLVLYAKGAADVPGRFKHLRVDYEIETVDVSGSSALVFGKMVGVGLQREDGEPYLREVWETLVFRKRAGRWQLVHEQSVLAGAEEIE